MDGYRTIFVACDKCHWRANFSWSGAVTIFACVECGASFTADPAAGIEGPEGWDAELRIPTLVDCLRNLAGEPTLRKKRLFVCGVARSLIGLRDGDWLRQAVEFGEGVADGERSDLRVRRPILDGLRNEFGARAGYTPELDVGLICIAPRTRINYVLDTIPGLVISPDTLRDIFPNPFRTIDWRADWFTSAVRDLARGIYDRREFGFMPILADALLEAGCDNPVILDHCRAARPHARGCWVVDALLGHG